MKEIDGKKLQAVLKLLEERLKIEKSSKIELVVCGGSALIATNLISRTTKDLDVVAQMKNGTELIDPEPLPEKLLIATKVVAQNYNLPDDWLNCGPSDLFRMGLPENFYDRLIKNEVGEHLTVYYIGRLDQIFFKLYASVDRGGYHIQDLVNLKPTTKELIMASRWTITHDVSEGYLLMLKQLLEALDYKDVIEQI